MLQLRLCELCACPGAVGTWLLVSQSCRLPLATLPAGIALGTFGVAAAALAAEGAPLSDLWPGYDNPLSWGIMIWSALGPGALAAFLHAKVGGGGTVRAMCVAQDSLSLAAGCKCYRQ